MVDQVILYSDQISDIVERVVKLCHSKTKTQKHQRVIISLAGIPGSGKSTLASIIVKELNKHNKAVLLPQDGFHLYRAELERLPNPQQAVVRRGAPFTFNAKAFLELIKKLSNPKFANETIKAPSFDHGVKDPIEDDIVIDPSIQIVIIEGNYVSLKYEYWNEISKYVDETWFLETPINIVRERIIKRHLETGISSDKDQAIARADGNDLLNAKYIVACSKLTDVLIITR